MLILQLVRKLVKILRSAASPFQVAGGFALGMLLGFTSFKTLFAVPVILCLVLLNVNLAAAILGILIFRLVAYLADPLIHSLGFWILTRETLVPLWRGMYNLPLVPYLRYNNTVVIGSVITGLILFIPVYLGVKRLIVAYNERLREKIQRMKFIKALNGSFVFKWVRRVLDLRG
jgi:uncharacterized protein (TIGR03546 family)